MRITKRRPGEARPRYLFGEHTSGEMEVLIGAVREKARQASLEASIEFWQMPGVCLHALAEKASHVRVYLNHALHRHGTPHTHSGV